MKKVNLEEGNAALERVLLLMKYDMSKTLNENKGFVSEQGQVTGAPKGFRNFSLGVYGVGGFGTDEQKLIDAFNEFTSVQDYVELENYIKKYFKRPNYSIQRALNGELGIGDANVAEQIQTKLKGLGIQMEFQTTPSGVDVVDGSIKIEVPSVTEEPKKEDEKKEDEKNIQPEKPKWVKSPSEEEVKVGKKMLKSGMAGEFVKKVQQTLNDISVQEGNPNINTGKVDGYFGSKTKQGLQNFQISVGLKGDGVLGKDTYSILFRQTDSEPTTLQPKDLQQVATPPQPGQVQRASTIPSVQTAHVDPKPTIKESMKNNLKQKLVEKTKEKENLLIETKIINNRFNLISEGLVIESVDDQVQFIDDIIIEMNYMVSQGYSSKVINEGLFSMLGGLFGGSLKSIPSVFGEYIAQWLTRTLGIPEGSFLQASIMALVGNLNIADYDKFFTDCRFASNKIADSLIEGYVIQMQKRAEATSQGATGFIVSALRNAVSEHFLEDKDGIIQILQDKIGDFICPKLSKVSSVIADKAQDIKDKAVA